MSPRRKRLYGFTALLLTATALVPATSWLVRTQILGTFGIGPTTLQAMKESPDTFAVQENYAKKHPQDAPAQFGVALQGGTLERLPKLLALHEQVPQNLAVSSAYLRQASTAISVEHLDEQELLSAKSNTPARPVQKNSNKNRPEELARFLQIATESEKLDPNNAYFPYMQAVGLMAENREDEAIATLKRASEKTEYNEYIFEEVDARWHLTTASQGQEVGGLARTAVWASTLFPQYALMRAMGRVTVGMAVEKELAGNQAEGLAIRKATAHMGGIMRSEASSYIGGLVGSAIMNTAASRPGGAEPLPKMTDDQGSERLQKQRVEDYCAYLNSLGEQKEVAYFRAEVAAQAESKKIWNAAMAKSWIMNPDIDRLIPLWVSAFLLIGSVAGISVFGGLFSLLNRFSRRTQVGEPMASEAKWGVWLGVTTFLASGFTIANLTFQWYSLIPASLLIPSVILLATPFARRYKGAQIGRGMGIMGLTLLFLGTLGFFLAFPLLTGGQMLGALLNTVSSLDSGSGLPRWAIIAMLVGFGIVLTLPLLLLIGLTITSRVMKMPVSVGVARSYARLAGPVVAVLLMGYAGLAIATSGSEQKATQSLIESTRHEGKFLAHLTGMTWPARTPQP